MIRPRNKSTESRRGFVTGGIGDEKGCARWPADWVRADMRLLLPERPRRDNAFVYGVTNAVVKQTRQPIFSPMPISSGPLVIAGREFRSRLILGTGKFSSPEAMRAALDASGTEIVTVALRRADLSGQG